jgi:hypothetical protein
MKYLVALSALGFSGLVLAQASLPAFDEVDANSDGEISMEESATIEGLDFATADTDQSGSLNREEYTAAQS